LQQSVVLASILARLNPGFDVRRGLHFHYEPVFWALRTARRENACGEFQIYRMIHFFARRRLDPKCHFLDARSKSIASPPGFVDICAAKKH